MKNQGFVVKNDRFHLENTSRYILDGWIVPGTKIEAFLDQKPLQTEVEQLTDRISEKEQGAEAVLYITVPEDTSGAKTLKVYAQNTGRHLCFRIPVKVMEEKRKGIRCFIDSVYLNRQDDVCKIQGWCIGKEPVKMVLTDKNHEKIECEIERFNRKDVAVLYSEAELDPHCGFFAELHPIPRDCFYLLMKCGEEKLVKTVPTAPAAHLK